MKFMGYGLDVRARERCFAIFLAFLEPVEPCAARTVGLQRVQCYLSMAANCTSNTVTNSVEQSSWALCARKQALTVRAGFPLLLQDSVKPAVLYNHDNEYLHYEDDWYILASKPEEYVVVYYRGNNDAWKGYGGAVVYTRWVMV